MYSGDTRGSERWMMRREAKPTLSLGGDQRGNVCLTLDFDREVAMGVKTRRAHPVT
ncbi:hypothetical protein SAMN05216266_11979 [Amycolatopsis marina]|uniref:Uncharacterized protein n=1 Tax=Amycolatopsis marina TaxID=490629 RepID=A0A1I1C072_9PSEU|nr:hypothetical protein SAMN05216266_11979 [Amycolatopsis marina]